MLAYLFTAYIFILPGFFLSLLFYPLKTLPPLRRFFLSLLLSSSVFAGPILGYRSILIDFKTAAVSLVFISFFIANLSFLVYSFLPFTQVGAAASAVFLPYLLTYLLLLLLENLRPGTVTYFFDPNLILSVVLLSGLLTVITRPGKYNFSWFNLSGRYEWLLILFLSLAGQIIVFYRTAALGRISLLISLLAFAAIGLISFLSSTRD